MANEAKPDAAPPAPEAPKDSGGSKIGVILAVLNLLLTVGIGAIVFTQFQKDKKKESVADIQSKEAGGEHGEAKKEEGHGEHGEAKKEEGGHGEHGGEPAKEEGGHGGHGEHGAASAKSGPKVISLEQFTVNLSTTVGTPPRFARVMIAIEVPSDETGQELTQKMPQVRNAIIDLFNSKRPSDLQTGEGRNFLKEEIRNALNSFLVTGKVRGVFFSNFAISS